ncbi:uncharacterized protein LOC131891395 isoform X2 [Tigriopus californicus]|uniref:uncharacterized protein LOC131891395 isoform X2 n=1 Tax=Tigriopus californicus TaxID=6832 RepID=UPI0027DA3E88|nr:uncharacterized protein LOC131891395 isoform X2 [Tigriopus californicus]
MKVALSILFLAFIGLSSADNVEIKSSDELELTYKPQEDHPLFGNPGSTTKLMFQLKNNGADGLFSVSTTSSISPEMLGESVSEINVPNGRVGTVLINNIQIPNKSGTRVTLGVNLRRVSPGITNVMQSVSRTVIFTIGEAPSDQDQPEIERGVTSECSVPKNDTRCENYKWHAEFEVQDEGVGLQSLNIQSMGRDPYTIPIFYKYENFDIGTTDDVALITDVSCCVEGVSITATDLKGNQVTKDFVNGGNGAISASAPFAILLIALSIAFSSL